MNRPLMERTPKPDSHMPGLMTRQQSTALPCNDNGPMAPMTQRAADRHAKNSGSTSVPELAEKAPKAKAAPKRKII